MEPIALCGAVIVAFCLWVEFEFIVLKIARAISNSKIMTAITSSTAEEKPVYVKYMTGIGT